MRLPSHLDESDFRKQFTPEIASWYEWIDFNRLVQDRLKPLCFDVETGCSIKDLEERFRIADGVVQESNYQHITVKSMTQYLQNALALRGFMDLKKYNP